MINAMKQPSTMKVKDFGNRLKTLNCYQTCISHDDEKDTVLSNTNLMALLLKSMPLSWQEAYLLKVHTLLTISGKCFCICTATVHHR